MTRLRPELPALSQCIPVRRTSLYSPYTLRAATLDQFHHRERLCFRFLCRVLAAEGSLRASCGDPAMRDANLSWSLARLMPLATGGE
jgi:hypothetical protein